MASHKKDVGDVVTDVLEDVGWKLAESIENGIWRFTDAIAGFFESLTDKIIDSWIKESGITAQNAGRGTVSPASPKFLKKGDVVFARRMVYHHYGIYAGRKKVIHYVKKESGVQSKTAIGKTSIGEFSKGDPVYVIRFPKKVDFLYSPGETLKRAKSRIGRADYNLVFNNCEHFALWCKTGRHESSQVKHVCERLFNKEFELDEARVEIAEKAFWAVSDFADAVEEKITGLMERLAGVPRSD